VKVVILAGGIGSRIAEESHLRPKPMIEVGGRPILWHIMKLYAHYGVYDFVVCLGYKGYVVKEYFSNYVLHRSDVTVDLTSNDITYHNSASEPWRVTLIETGADTQTGGRLKRAAPYLDAGESFCMTYGDGVGDIDIAALLTRHREAGLAATVTVVRPPGRFGATEIDDGKVTRFVEKAVGDSGAINGGFFVLEPAALDTIEDDATIWEQEPLRGLAERGELAAYSHDGFWQPMDTLREKILLERLWASGTAPWKVWV